MHIKKGRPNERPFFMQRYRHCGKLCRRHCLQKQLMILLILQLVTVIISARYTAYKITDTFSVLIKHAEVIVPAAVYKHQLFGCFNNII